MRRVMFKHWYLQAHRNTVAETTMYGHVVSIVDDRYIILGDNGMYYWKHITNIIGVLNGNLK